MTSLSSSERPSSKPQVCAIDIGTSGVRAALFDDRGHEVPAHRRAAAARLRQFPTLQARRRSTRRRSYKDGRRAPRFLLRRSGQVHRHLRVLAQPDRHRRRRATNHASTDLGRHSRRSIRKTVAVKFRRARDSRAHRLPLSSELLACKLEWLKSEHNERFRDTRCWLGFAEPLPALVWRARDVDLDGVCNGAVQSTRMRVGSGSRKRSASRPTLCLKSKPNQMHVSLTPLQHAGRHWPERDS